MAELIFNDYGTSLDGGINNSTTSLTVSSSAAFPDPFSGQCRIRIDDEILLVTALNHGTRVLTVTRGYENTIPLEHSSGAQVTHILTAGGLETYVTETAIANGGSGNTSGALSSIPGTANDGDMYFPTDAPFVYRSNGSVWSAFGPIWKMTPPTTSTLGTWVNQGSSTFTNANGGTLFVAPANSGDQNRLVVTAAPSAPYTVTARWFVDAYPSNYFTAGLVLYETSTGKLLSFGTAHNNGSVQGVTRWNSVSSFSSSPFSGASINNTAFFRVVNNSTTLTFSISQNGFDFTNVVYTENVNAFFTTGPSHIGLVADSNNSKPVSVFCMHWSVT